MKQQLERIENTAIDVIAVFAPWLGPIPSAYLVGRACEAYLHWHWSIALVAAIAVESIGVVSVVLSLRLYEWNQTITQKETSAPFNLSVILVAIYFLVTIGLTVLLDVIPTLARFAPAIFPLLAAVGAVNIAVKNGQQRREAARFERKEERKVSRQNPIVLPPKRPLLPEITGQETAVYSTDWRKLPEEARQEIGNMETAEIVVRFGISERTARNWRKNARKVR